MSSYTIRRLMQTYKDALLQTEQTPPLTEMMLWEPDELLKRLSVDDAALTQVTSTLEVLARAYQSRPEGGQPSGTLSTVEQQIFMTLNLTVGGHRMSASASAVPATQDLTLVRAQKYTAGEIVGILQEILNSSAMYLGPKIAGDYFRSSQPAAEWLKYLTIGEKNKLNWSGPTSEVLLSQEIEDVRTWVQDYLRHCSAVIGNFAALLDPALLQRLSLL